MSSNQLVVADGFEWISRAGRLWGNYQTCAEYIGMTEGHTRNIVSQHHVPTIRHGRKALVSKDDLDQATGAMAA